MSKRIAVGVPGVCSRLAVGILFLALQVGCAPLGHRHPELVGPPGPPGPPGTTYTATPVFADSWSGVAAGAAAGYCMAKHPYLSNTTDPFTTDGYEKVASPGIVGVARRNFVAARTDTGTDAGLLQTCDQACRQAGRGYEPTYQGRALRQRLSDGRLITSGLGDLASSVITDFDFYLGRTTVSGMISRGNNWHEYDVNSPDVAQADFCCCHVTAP